MNSTGIFAAVLAIALLLRGRKLMELILEAMNNFRGGPPTPMHPSPANDGALLCRRSRNERELPFFLK